MTKREITSSSRLLLLRMQCWTFVVVSALLLCSSVASASGPSSDVDANGEYIETVDTFVEAYEATRHDKPIVPLKLGFWTAPNRDWDSTLLRDLKAIVVRFDLHLINFHPHMYVADGQAMGCRPQKTHYGKPPLISDECMANCQNMGRYCSHTFTELDDPAHAALTGAQIVAQSARRLCMWITYGTANGDRTHILMLWDYVARLRESKCDLSLTDECIDQVYTAVGVENNRMTNCFHHSGGLGPEVDMKNEILGQEMFRSNRINASAVTRHN